MIIASKKGMPVLGVVDAAPKAGPIEEISLSEPIPQIDLDNVVHRSREGIYWCPSCGGALLPRKNKETKGISLNCFKCNETTEITLKDHMSSTKGCRGFVELKNGITVFYAEDKNALEGYTGMKMGDLGIVLSENEMDDERDRFYHNSIWQWNGQWYYMIFSGRIEAPDPEDLEEKEESLEDKLRNGIQIGNFWVTFNEECSNGGVPTLTVKTRHDVSYHIVDSLHFQDIDSNIDLEYDEFICTSDGDIGKFKEYDDGDIIVTLLE